MSSDEGEGDPCGGRCNCCMLACAVCRILLYNCYRKIYRQRQDEMHPRPEFHVLCVGLQGVGKSSLLAVLAGERESLEEVQPTQGFSYKTILTENAILQVQELGGSDKIRLYWNRYFNGQDGMIFVVDSTASDEDMLETSKQLTRCLTAPELKNVPVLILCNKHDLPGAKSTHEIEELLDMNSITNQTKYFIRSCSALSDPQSLHDSMELFTNALTSTSSQELM